MNLTTKAIVINRIKYKDNGMIVKLYTEEKGLLSFIIRNVNRKKNKLTALYQPLTILKIQALIKENSTLHYIKEANVEDPLNDIHQHPIKLGVSMFIADILYKTMNEEEPNTALFHFLVYALHWLELTERTANFPISFLVNLSTYYGFPPKLNNTTEDMFFDLREGQFQSNQPALHQDFLSSEISKYLGMFLGSNFDETSNIKMDSKNRKSLLNKLIIYFQIHMDQLKNIQSHVILEETFNT